MKKFLFIRILVLLLFLVAIIVVPLVAFIGLIVVGAISGISIYNNAKSNPNFSARDVTIAFVIGVIVFFSGFYFIGKLSNNYEALGFFIIASFCAAIIFVSLKLFRNFVSVEEDYFPMDEKVHKFTKFYPTLMIISAAARLIVETALLVAKNVLTEYVKYLNAVTWIAGLLFVVAIIQYIVRMIHIYVYNK